MASQNDYISIVISLSTPRPPSTEAFGVPLIAAYHTHWNDRSRTYTSLPAMVADGFTVTEPAYLQAQVLASAEDPPAQWVIGRRALPPLQVIALTLTSTAATDTYAGTFVDSAGVSHALSVPSTGVPATDCATVATAITAFSLSGCTVSHTGAIVTLTQTAGHLVDVRDWTNQILQLADNTADPGLATDLAAIIAANPLGWYALLLDSNSKAEVTAALAFIEATGKGGKVGFFTTADFAVAAGTSGNIELAAKSASYGKSLIAYSGKRLLNFLGAGAAAFALANPKGAFDLAWQVFPGVEADDDSSLTETQALTMNTGSTATPGTGGQNGNYYRVVAGQPIFWPGVTPSGAWMDQVMGIDQLQVTAQANLFAYRAGLVKLPLTDFGIGGAGDNLRSTINSFATPPTGGDPNALLDGTRPITIVKPAAASLSPVDRQNRNLAGLGATAFFSNAANTIGVQITVGT